jgi:hypothetical protein
MVHSHSSVVSHVWFVVSRLIGFYLLVCFEQILLVGVYLLVWFGLFRFSFFLHFCTC